MRLNAGLNNLFPTQVTLSQINIRQEHIDEALQGNVHPDIKEAVVDAWDNYLTTVVGKPLSDWKYKTQEWVNIYHRNEMEYHTHNGAHISTVVYIENQDIGGEITFYDPRNFAARGYDMSFRHLFDSITHMPKSGDVVTFPAFIYHAVRPAEGLRISAAFDLFLFNDD